MVIEDVCFSVMHVAFCDRFISLYDSFAFSIQGRFESKGKSVMIIHSLLHELNIRGAVMMRVFSDCDTQRSYYEDMQFFSSRVKQATA